MPAPAFTLVPAAWPLLASAGLSVLLAIWVWPRRHVPGGVPLFVALLLYPASALCRAVMLWTPVFDLQVSLRAWWGVTVYLLVAASLWRSLDYAGLAARFLAAGGWALTLLPAVVFSVLMLTDSDHGWFWNAIWYDDGLRSSLGPAGYLGIAWSLAMGAASIAVTARAAALSNGLLRRQAAVLGLGTTLGVLAAAADGARHSHWHDTQISAALWLLAIVAMAVALFRLRAIDLAPIARHTVLERMTDGVLVLDDKSRMVDINPAAARLFAVDRNQIIGQHAVVAFRNTPELINLLIAPLPFLMRDIIAGTGAGGGEARNIEVELMPAGANGHTPHGSAARGRIVLCRDVTELQAAEASLERQHLAVAALQERERLARELHDGLAQVLAYTKLRVQTTIDALDQGRVAQARTDLAELSLVLQQANEEVRDLLLSTKPGRHPGQDLSQQVADFVVGFAAQHPFQVHTVWRTDPAALHLDPETQFQVVRIVQESLVNAQRHSRAPSATLEFDLRDGALHAIVRDEGAGFDAHGWQAPECGGNHEGKREAGHYGLRFMCERAEAVGGTLEIASQPGCGTEIHLAVPCGNQREAVRRLN